MNNEKKRIYLDDVRTPIGKDWIIVRNYEHFVSTIRLYGLENFEVISLDHDLGEESMIEYYTNVKNNYENIFQHSNRSVLFTPNH